MSRFVIFALYCLVVVSCDSQKGNLTSRVESSYAGRGRGESHQRCGGNAESSCGRQEPEPLSRRTSTAEERKLDGLQQENSLTQRSLLPILGLVGLTQDPDETTESNRSEPDRRSEEAQETHKFDVEGNEYNKSQELIEVEKNEGDKNSQNEFLHGPFSLLNGTGLLPNVNIFPLAQMILPSSDAEKSEPENPDVTDDVCFPVVGCFDMSAPWTSLLRPFEPPQSPENIKAKVLFYSRANSKRPANITLYPEIKMGEAHFDPTKRTAMIVHGFASSGDAEWMAGLKDLYLQKYDANVMVVDWGGGAQLFNYLQVASNTRVVGRLLAMFVEFLIKTYGADTGTFHLIGHSLGAQISAYVGKQVQGIGRLTALDPAQPGFEGFDSKIRLDSDDAIFVDVIHTDGKPFLPTLGFGMITPHGDVDFYLNGGFEQPGCLPSIETIAINSILDLAKFPVEVLFKLVACPHSRAYEYFMESLNETAGCTFWGNKIDLIKAVKAVSHTVTQGLLKMITSIKDECSMENCVPLGFYTPETELRGSFVITTNGAPPFCLTQPEAVIKQFHLGPVKPESKKASKRCRR